MKREHKHRIDPEISFIIKVSVGLVVLCAVLDVVASHVLKSMGVPSWMIWMYLLR